MTTEASSETEVKENAEESAAQVDQSEKTAGESQEVGSGEGEAKEKEKAKDGKGISRYLPTWLKKQKSQSQVGASHHRSLGSLVTSPATSQKISPSLYHLPKTSPTKEVPAGEEVADKVKEGDEGADPPEVNGHAEEVEEGEEVKSKQQQEKEEAESHSNGSADTEVGKRHDFC